jgi:hypothetical protein
VDKYVFKCQPLHKLKRCGSCRLDKVRTQTRVGTFACHTFPCDTKASKRANFCSRTCQNDKGTKNKKKKFEETILDNELRTSLTTF